MSAERAIAVFACSLCLGTAVMAKEEPAPDAEFLEYLGMWQESDEEWLMHEEMQTTDLDERSDPVPVPDGEESTETKDES